MRALTWQARSITGALLAAGSLILIAAGSVAATPGAQIAGCAGGAWHAVQFNSSNELVQNAAESITGGDLFLAVLDNGQFEMLWNDLTVTRTIGRVSANIAIDGSSSGTLTEIAPGLVSGVTDRTVMRTTISVAGQPPVERMVDVSTRDDGPPATYECIDGRLETTVSIPGGGVVRLVFERLVG